MVIVFSIIAALQVINGALATTEVFSDEVAGIIALVIGALTAGAAFYVRGMTAPVGHRRRQDQRAGRRDPRPGRSPQTRSED